MMIAQVRVTLTGDGPWQAVLADDQGELGRHSIAVIRDGARVYPAAATGGLAAATLTATVDSLRDGGAASAAVVELGRHLFAALCVPAWPAIEARLGATPPDLLELALELDGAPALRGLPWELMVGPAGWLAQAVAIGGALVDVAITRRTARGVASRPTLAHPLRYLFVIGTGLGDEIRAGAECFGLLRQLGSEVQERIVERLSLAELGRVIAEFDPHVVHVICHGRETESGGVELELWDAERSRKALVSGAALAEAVVRPGADGQRRAPAIVVLSACSSGDRMLPPGDSGVARALVAAGVPLVIGMGAAIRDQACRLFALGLGQAMAQRSPVLAAASRGRRVALRAREQPADAFDWGLIQLVLGHDTAAGLAVAPAAAESDEARVTKWLAGSGLEIDLPNSKRVYPPLCGGAEAIEAFYRLLAGPQAALILVARPPSERVKVGKRRILSELAAIAIRAGHVPVVVIAPRVAGPPRTPAQLVERLVKAFKAAWVRHGLGPPTSNQLAALAAAGALDADLLADALTADAAALRDRARAAHGLIARAAGQVVLMLHDVHAYGDAVRLVLDLLTVRAANLRDVAPVVVTWRSGPARGVHDDELDQTWEQGKAWLAKLDLVPLAPIDPYSDDTAPPSFPIAARLALQRVLLHPFRDRPEYATRRWLLDLGDDSPVSREVLRDLVEATWGCCLGQFDDDGFLLALRRVLRGNRLAVADDDQLLAAGVTKP